MPAKKEKKNTTIDIVQLQEGRLSFCILGRTPIVLNRMSEKARRELLLPRKKNAAEKASTLKHRPPEEYRASVYVDPDDNGPTYVQYLATAFKGAMMEAALDIPGTNKTQIQRLVWVNDERIALYGIPKLLMAVTRCADRNRTPDVRTRAIIADWACSISISFRMPNLREVSVANLLAAAGVTPGVGDWRVGKGSGVYGQFEIVDADNPQYTHIVQHGGRAAQISALENPEPYDLETEELLSWFHDERDRRGFKAKTTPKKPVTRKTKKGNSDSTEVTE